MKGQKIAPYLFILPFFVTFVAFEVGPIGYALFMSLHRVRSLKAPMKFVGLFNYSNVLSDPRFLHSLVIVGEFTAIAVTFMLGFAVLLSLLLNVRFRGRVAYRTAYFLPIVTSLVAAAIFFKIMFGERLGMLNVMLRMVGLPGYRWLNDPKLMLFSLIIVVAWRSVGFYLIIFLAALQNIPQELYDAAKVDGANVTQALAHITLPLLFPTIFFCIIIATISSLQLFDEPFVLFTVAGRSALYDEILVPAVYLYSTAFETFRLGKAATMGFVISGVIFALTLFQIKIMGRKGGLG